MIKYKISLILLISALVSIVYGRSANGYYSQNAVKDISRKSILENTIKNDKSDFSNDFWNDLWDLYRVYQKCPDNNLVICLKMKLAKTLQKITINKNNMKILNGVQFIKDMNATNEIKNTKILTEEEIEASLPRSLDDKEQYLNNLIFENLLAFLKSHTLEVKFPYSSELERSFKEDSTEEGRKKKDKKNQAAYIMIPLLIKGFVVPLAFGGLALLAGKALIVSKLALVLASIIGIKKLLSGGGAKETQHEVVVSSGHGGSGWGRDIDLAYSAHEPASEEKYKQM